MKTDKIILFALLLCASWVIPVSAQSDLSKGKKLIETGQINSANKFFIEQVSKEPTNAEAIFLLAETYFDLGKLDSAENNYKRGEAIGKKFPFNTAGLGRIAMVKGDTLKAKELFNLAIKSDKKNGDLFAYIAKSAVAANQPQIAAWYVAKGKEVAIKNPQIHIAEGDLWKLNGRAGDAVNAYERANDYDKNLPITYVKIGYIFIDARTFQVAADNFNKALAIDPNYPLAFKGLGDMSFKTGDFQAASDNYKKYISMVEENLEDMYRFAFILFYNKEYTEASKILDNLLAKDPKNPVLLRIQGYMLYEMGIDEKGNVVNPQNISNALANMNRFLEVQSQDKYLSSDFEYLAKIQMASNLDSLVPQNYLKAYRLDTIAGVRFVEDAAKAYRKIAKYDSAAITYQKLLSITDENKLANYFAVGQNYWFSANQDTAKADSLKRREKLLKADTAFQKVIELKPDLHLGYLNRGRIAAILDTLEVGLANEFYQKVIDLIIDANEQVKRKNDLIDAYAYFGAFYYIKAWNARVEKNNAAYQDFKTKSIDYWNKILEIAPNNPKAVEGMKALEELAKMKGQ